MFFLLLFTLAGCCCQHLTLVLSWKGLARKTKLSVFFFGSFEDLMKMLVLGMILLLVWHIYQCFCRPHWNAVLPYDLVFGRFFHSAPLPPLLLCFVPKRRSTIVSCTINSSLFELVLPFFFMLWNQEKCKTFFKNFLSQSVRWICSFQLKGSPIVLEPIGFQDVVTAC